MREAVYTNEDLAVVGPEKRHWGTWNFAALWISMSLCIPTYMMASSLIEGGMNWWQGILTVLVGNMIVLIPMVLNGHAGARYGIPFPVLARASFGMRGANIPALLRAIVACGWFGIQTWIGGLAIYQIVHAWHPHIIDWPNIFPEWVGLTTGPAVTFVAFWALNVFVVYKGIESIRKLLLFKAAFLPIAAIALLCWAVWAANGLGPILSRPDQFKEHADFWKFFFPALTGIVGFWATISLNIPDFTRYATSQRAQILGQALALPTSMAVFAFVGVVVTSATAIIFGEMIWDPVILAGRFDSPLLVTFAMLAVAVSTLATNIAANIVSPANDFANLMPDKIDFKRGGYITALIGLFILPWKLVNDPTGFIFTWLIAYSSLLGPIGGIMIVDYFIVRKRHLHADELYSPAGRYWFGNGFHMAAIISLLAGIAPNIPGFLVTIRAVPEDSFPDWLSHLYHYAWFVGFAVSGVIYYFLHADRKGTR